MTKKAVLILEDGAIYEGYSFGAATTTHGEVVFDTAMAGYQEVLTDSSFAGQIVVPCKRDLTSGVPVVEKGIPCFTSLDTACVVWKVLALEGQVFNVKPSQDYI